MLATMGGCYVPPPLRLMMLHCFSSYLVPPRAEIKRVPLGSNAILVGETVVLDCEPQEGDLPFDYSWFDPNDDSLSTSQKITVTFDSDMKYGLYSCMANNSFGRHTSTYFTEKAGRLCSFFLFTMPRLSCMALRPPNSLTDKTCLCSAASQRRSNTDKRTSLA